MFKRLFIALSFLSVLSTCSLFDSNNENTSDNSLPFRTNGDFLEVYTSHDKRYEPLFLMGINLGVGVPGTYAGELAATREQYENWLQLIADAGINNLRIYTLHYPRFYSVLNDFNTARVQKNQKPVYLFQGIWLDEQLINPDETDLVMMSEDFQNTIKQVVDAVHGNIEIDQRYGEAYGNYSVNASKWVMGYILGREIHPNEVRYTNSNNSELDEYNGNVFSIEDSTPTEVWATQQLEFTVSYERENYGTERPISFTSWPTLDPINHPTETSYEDREQLDLQNINVIDAPAGLFYSFHAYPYYPDFISEDSTYRAYSDSTGNNSYLGYLTDLKAHYFNRPLVIAEFGAPSSWGNIHSAHNGIHHGGHTEEKQAEHTVRMLNNLLQANTAGGMLFALIDEWWKPTWLTNVFDFPFNRRAYWHNVLAPEQNYGLVAFDSEIAGNTVLKKADGTSWTGNTISSVKLSYNAAYLYISLETTNFTENNNLVIGFDTYDDDLGEKVLPSNTNTNTEMIYGYEFALNLFHVDDNWKAELNVTQAYDLFGLWNNEHDPEIQKLKSIATSGEAWNLVKWKTNYASFANPAEQDTFYGHTENTVYEIGNLPVSEVGGFTESNQAVAISEDAINIRIPWGLLQFTDPSRLQVFHDDPQTSLKDSLSSTGVRLGIAIDGKTDAESERYLWDPWSLESERPKTTERLKPAYGAYKNAISLINTE